MDIGKVVNQAKDIILNPTKTIKKLKDEKIKREDLIFYLAIVSIPSFLGVLIGYGTAFDSRFIGWGVGLAIIMVILQIIGVFVFGYILNAIAENFKSKKNLMNALKLVTYSMTPALITGIFNAFYGLSWISLLGGIYGIYILYIGLPVYMETPEDQQIIYLIIAIVIMFVIMAVVWGIITQIWSAAVIGSYYPYGYPPYYP